MSAKKTKLALLSGTRIRHMKEDQFTHFARNDYLELAAPVKHGLK